MLQFSRFGSDIGGTVGLWLGLSIFSFVELLNFVGHIFKYIYYSCSGKKQEPDRFQQPRGRHPQYMRDFMGNMPPGPFPDDDYYQGPYRRWVWWPNGMDDVTQYWPLGLAWWRHQMETFSALLAICAGNSPVPGEFPGQRQVTRSFHVFFDLRLNKRLSKQSWDWWLETL